jgi:hypothetical protein
VSPPCEDADEDEDEDEDGYVDEDAIWGHP